MTTNDKFNDLLEKIHQEKIKALKEIFKYDIKESFLINVYNRIRDNYPNIIQFYPNIFDINTKNTIQGTNDRIDFDLCCHIVEIHKFNMLFLSDGEKGALQKDSKYITKLCEKVYEQIKIRNVGSSFFRNKSLSDGDRFLYFPLAYDVFAITICLLGLVNEKCENVDLWGFYQSMLNQIMSILTLIENDLILQAFPHLRNLIELFFKYEVVKGNKKAIDEYYKFCEYEIEYKTKNTFNDNFLRKYKKAKDCSRIDYLHFGWIDVIIEFGYLGEDKKYSIPGLYNFLVMKNKEKTFLNDLKEMHNICHSFSHGSTLSRLYPIQSYFEFMYTLFYITNELAYDLESETGQRIILNNVNLIETLKDDFKNFEAKHRMMTDEGVKKYYENHKWSIDN